MTPLNDQTNPEMTDLDTPASLLRWASGHWKTNEDRLEALARVNERWEEATGALAAELEELRGQGYRDNWSDTVTDRIYCHWAIKRIKSAVSENKETFNDHTRRLEERGSWIPGAFFPIPHMAVDLEEIQESVSLRTTNGMTPAQNYSIRMGLEFSLLCARSLLGPHMETATSYIEGWGCASKEDKSAWTLYNRWLVSQGPELTPATFLSQRPAEVCGWTEDGLKVYINFSVDDLRHNGPEGLTIIHSDAWRSIYSTLFDHLTAEIRKAKKKKASRAARARTAAESMPTSSNTNVSQGHAEGSSPPNPLEQTVTENELPAAVTAGVLDQNVSGSSSLPVPNGGDHGDTATADSGLGYTMEPSPDEALELLVASNSVVDHISRVPHEDVENMVDLFGSYVHLVQSAKSKFRQLKTGDLTVATAKLLLRRAPNSHRQANGLTKTAFDDLRRVSSQISDYPRSDGSMHPSTILRVAKSTMVFLQALPDSHHTALIEAVDLLSTMITNFQSETTFPPVKVTSSLTSIFKSFNEHRNLVDKITCKTFTDLFDLLLTHHACNLVNTPEDQFLTGATVKQAADEIQKAKDEIDPTSFPTDYICWITEGGSFPDEVWQGYEKQFKKFATLSAAAKHIFQGTTSSPQEVKISKGFQSLPGDFHATIESAINAVEHTQNEELTHYYKTDEFQSLEKRAFARDRLRLEFLRKSAEHSAFKPFLTPIEREPLESAARTAKQNWADAQAASHRAYEKWVSASRSRKDLGGKISEDSQLLAVSELLATFKLLDGSQNRSNNGAYMR